MNRFSLAFVSILAFASVAHGQVSYNRFAPANGVLKGNTATYVTMPAASSDIIGLWTGTCSSATFLRGDGSCQTPAGGGGGTVNSVALAAPSVFGVTGSPVTNTGTLTLAFASGQTANSFLASPDGSTGAVGLRLIVADDLPPIDLTSGVTGTLPVANGGTAVTSLGNLTKADDTNVTLTLGGTPTGALIKATSITAGWTGQLAAARGGTGAATLSGVLKGNGTSAIGSAASADVYALWSGTCSSTTFLRGDGSCQTPAGTTAGANPTGTIGLSAVNGVATTFLRSDGAPALSQAITPTWTGAHVFSGAGNRMTVNTTSGNDLATFQTGGVTRGYLAIDGGGSGIFSGAGETGQGVYVGSSAVLLQDNNTTVMTFDTGGHFSNGATGGAQGSGTINATGLYINGVAVGSAANARIVRKPSGTTRSSTTATADPDLAIVPNITGVYSVTGFLDVSGLNNGNGLKIAIQTASTVCKVLFDYPLSTAAVTRQFQAGGGSPTNLASISVGSSEAVTFTGVCTVGGGSDTISVVWSANTVVTGTTGLNTGSWMTATIIP